MSRVIAIRLGTPRVLVLAGLRGAPGNGSGSSSGVSSFNTRKGNVTLTGSDVTAALGYTPAASSALASVAFSGSYNDLSGKPAIPSAPSHIGAATAAQGGKADTAVQPDDLADFITEADLPDVSGYMTTAAASEALDGKVDKVSGKGLSEANFTEDEKTKLASLESGHFRGLFTTVAALADIDNPIAGNYAHVDAGEGDPVAVYVWDASDEEWVTNGGEATLTAAQVKTLYESNADTNAFTDARKDKLAGLPDATVSQVEAEAGTGTTVRSWTAQRVWQAASAAVASWWAASAMKTKLDGIATAATANAADAQLRDRSTHTGAQAISTVTGLETALAGKQAALVSGTNIKTVNGQSVLGSGDLTVAGAGAGTVNVSMTGTTRNEFLTAGDGTTRNANSISGDGEHWVEITNNPSSGAGKQLFRMNSYGVNSYGNNVHYCRYFGTEAAPAAIGAGAYLMSSGFRGYDGSALSQSAAAFQVVTTEAWSSGAHGVKFVFQTTPNGSTTRSTRMEIHGGGVSVSGVFDVNGVTVTGNAIPQSSKSANYTAVLADAGSHIYHPATDDAARTFTIPANATVAYPVGTTLTFINAANVVTIAITSDTLVLAGSGATGSRALAAHGMATAIKVTSTRWVLSGVGLS